MSDREKDISKIAKMYTKYLNGPLGSGVMDHLQEGESFTVKPYDKILEIHKQKGKAVVTVVESSIRSDIKKTNSL
ncbi:MAG: hypothetical protein ACXAAO_11430 [Candidatus Thorarchaeota archaeon]|jgi:hypothetical protein